MAFQGRKKAVLIVLGGVLVTGGFPFVSSLNGAPGVAHAAQGSWGTIPATNKRPLFRPIDRTTGHKADQPGRWRPQVSRSVRPGQDAFDKGRTRPWSWQPALNAAPAYGVGVADPETARQQGLKFRPRSYTGARPARVSTGAAKAPSRSAPPSAMSSGFRPAEARPRYERLYRDKRHTWGSSSFGSSYLYGVPPYYYSSSRLPR